ncbi:MAG: glycosyltransferase family 39 protein [Myxococcota bacterium]|nr:glycosyltransferase family 39 protein [Myxococcota bacterium]
MSRSLDHRPVVGHAVILGVILAIAASLRLLHLLSTARLDPFFYEPAVDPAIYLAWAKDIVAGKAPANVFFLSPGYPFFLAGLVALFGDDLFAIRAAHAALGWCGVALVYLLARQVIGPRAGLVAAGIAAICAPLVFYEQELLPAAIQGPSSLLGCLFLHRAEAKQRWWLFSLGGLFLGLASVARPNLLAACGFVAAWILWRWVRTRSAAVHPWQALPAFVLGCALPIVPLTLHNHGAGDAVLISAQGGHNFYIGNGPDATGRFVVPRLFSPDMADDPREQAEVYASYAEHVRGKALRPSEVSGFYYDLAFDHIRASPAAWAVLLGRKLLLFVNAYEASSSRDFDSSRRFSTALALPLLTTAWLMPLSLVGIVFVAWRGPRPMPILLVLAAHLVSGIAFFTLAHYRVPALPLLCVVAAVAVHRGIDALHAKQWRTLIVFATALFAAVPVVNLCLDDPQASQFMVAYNLGNRFRNQGKLEQAAQEYNRSLSLQPEYLPAHNNLALCLEGIPGQERSAIQQWRIVLEAGQSRGEALYIERARRHLLVLEQAASSMGPPREDR